VARTKHYRDLLAWQKAMILARTVYDTTSGFPKDEIFGLRLQLRRAAVSVPSNIAEGHGRLTDAQLGNALGIARGSLYEVQTQLQLARDLGFIDSAVAEKLLASSVDVAKLINGLLGVLNR
jgi:four helix bundle protein